jgi:hypothetical protein
MDEGRDSRSRNESEHSHSTKELNQVHGKFSRELNLKSFAQVKSRCRQLPMHMIAADIRFMALQAKPLAKLRAEAVAFLRSFSA